MTRPPPEGTTIDITDDACVHRLLALVAGFRSMRTLYPQLTADPALLSDFLLDKHLHQITMAFNSHKPLAV